MEDRQLQKKIYIYIYIYIKLTNDKSKEFFLQDFY